MISLPMRSTNPLIASKKLCPFDDTPTSNNLNFNEELPELRTRIRDIVDTFLVFSAAAAEVSSILKLLAAN